eukprot:11490579-Heterocapsa_arctica.AAC.1
MLLHKPWRVNTNSVRLLRPLSLRCDKTHAHSLTHGAATVLSGYHSYYGYYSDMMVKIIGEAITTQGE